MMTESEFLQHSDGLFAYIEDQIDEQGLDFDCQRSGNVLTIEADDGTHDSKTPLRLLDRVDGKKTVAKIAAGDAVRILLADPHQPCAKEAQLANGSICTDLWLLIQSKDGKTGWVKINYQRDTPDLEGLHPLAE